MGTKEETTEAVNEVLIEQYRQLTIRKYQLEQEETELINRLKAASVPCGKHSKVVGTMQLIKLNPTVNVSYEKERGEAGPLKEIYELDSDLVKLGYHESGNKIQKILDKADGDLTKVEIKVLDIVRSTRIVKDGKPRIEVKDKKK